LQVRGGSGCFDPICYERGIRMRYSVFTIEIEGHSEHIESESKRDVQMFLDKCGFEKKCVFKGVWSNIKERINEVLDNTTFEDMVDKTKKMLGTSVPDFCI